MFSKTEIHCVQVYAAAFTKRLFSEIGVEREREREGDSKKINIRM